MPFNIGPGELIIVLIIALIVVGPGKLPDVGAALGKSIREFRSSVRGDEDDESTKAVDAPPQATPSLNAFCTQCGAPADAGLRFCTACGHSLFRSGG